MASLVTDESTGIKYYVDDDTTEEAAAVSIFKGGPKPFYTPLRADSELAIRERLKNDSVVYFKDENVNNLPDHFTGLRAGDDALYNFTTGDKIPYGSENYHRFLDGSGTEALGYGFSLAENDNSTSLVLCDDSSGYEGFYINLDDLGAPYRQLSNGRRLYSLYVNTSVTGPAFALVKNPVDVTTPDGSPSFSGPNADRVLVFYLEGPINGKVEFITEDAVLVGSNTYEYMICINYPENTISSIIASKY